jgi:hypothetical protein
MRRNVHGVRLRDDHLWQSAEARVDRIRFKNAQDMATFHTGVRQGSQLISHGTGEISQTPTYLKLRHTEE